MSLYMQFKCDVWYHEDSSTLPLQFSLPCHKSEGHMIAYTLESVNDPHSVFIWSCWTLRAAYPFLLKNT